MAASTQGLAVRPQSTLDTVQEALSALAARYRGDEVLTAVRHIPAREAQFRPMPAWVRPELAAAYRAKGIDQLYSHQAAAAELARAGKDFVVVTPTASGKTLCYNLPVLNAILENTDTRALYLFPTKALAQDQLAELHDLADAPRRSASASSPTTAIRPATRAKPSASAATSSSRIRTCSTPASCRTTPSGRACSKTCATSCSTSCTPIAAFSAAIWRTSCGGSRASRSFTARDPQFICCSATIANPGELAAQLTERKMEVHRRKRRARRRKDVRLLQSADGQPQSRHSPQLSQRNHARRQGASRAQAANDRLRQ